MSLFPSPSLLMAVDAWPKLVVSPLGCEDWHRWTGTKRKLSHSRISHPLPPTRNMMRSRALTPTIVMLTWRFSGCFWSHHLVLGKQQKSRDLKHGGICHPMAGSEMEAATCEESALVLRSCWCLPAASHWGSIKLSPIITKKWMQPTACMSLEVDSLLMLPDKTLVWLTFLILVLSRGPSRAEPGFWFMELWVQNLCHSKLLHLL